MRDCGIAWVDGWELRRWISAFLGSQMYSKYSLRGKLFNMSYATPRKYRKIHLFVASMSIHLLKQSHNPLLVPVFSQFLVFSILSKLTLGRGFVNSPEHSAFNLFSFISFTAQLKYSERFGRLFNPASVLECISFEISYKQKSFTKVQAFNYTGL